MLVAISFHDITIQHFLHRTKSVTSNSISVGPIQIELVGFYSSLRKIFCCLNLTTGTQMNDELSLITIIGMLIVDR